MHNTSLSYSAALSAIWKQIADTADRHISTLQDYQQSHETIDSLTYAASVLLRDWAHYEHEEAELNRQASAELARQQAAAAARETETTAIF